MALKSDSPNLSTSKRYGEKGFTLIELIMVIVILGILTAIAVPRYQDMRREASDAAADGVFSGAQSASAINFANNLLQDNPTAFIDDGQALLDAMQEEPEGWSADGDNITATISGQTYVIGVTNDENATTKATIEKLSGWLP